MPTSATQWNNINLNTSIYEKIFRIIAVVCGIYHRLGTVEASR